MPMSDSDDWGRDPSVKMMRRVFGRMEESQSRFLELMNISFFDNRLRLWREKAREIFERSWEKATQSGMNINEEKAAVIYVNCLAKVLHLDGIEIPSEALTCNEEIERLLKESLP